MSRAHARLDEEAHFELVQYLALRERANIKLYVPVGPYTAFALVTALHLVLRREDLGFVMSEKLTALANDVRTRLADDSEPRLAEMLKADFAELDIIVSEVRRG